MKVGSHFIVAWFLVFLYGSSTGIMAQTASDFANTLENVEVLSLDKHERITLSFANDYEETPIIDFDLGLVYIRLNNTTINTAVREFNFEQPNHFIKKIQANRNQASTLLTIVLQSSRISLENQIKLERSGPQLFLDVERRAITTALKETLPVNDISEEMQERLRDNDTLPLPASVTTEPEIDLGEPEPSIIPQADGWMMTLLTLIFSLLLILLVMVVVLYLYKKLLSGRFPKIQGKYRIRAVSTFHLGPKQKVMVLEVNGNFFACGVTSNSINFLTEVQDEKDQAFLGDLKVSGDNIDINRSRADFLKTVEVARQKADKLEKAQVAPRKATPKKKTAQKKDFSVLLDDEQQTEAPKKKTKPQKEPEAPKKSFYTPIPPVSEEPLLENELSGDPSLQKFAKQLGSKLKSLKPIE